MVECTALEMRHRCKPIGGSNPSLSAICAVLYAKLRLRTLRFAGLPDDCQTVPTPRVSTEWICEMTVAPSPTAAATRLVEPARTSPIAKMPG